MSDAINNPARRQRRELATDDLEVGQKTNIIIDPNGSIDHESESLEALEQSVGLTMAYADALAFNEEPICIVIEKSNQKNPPKTVDCWVNGKGAEIFRDGKWNILGWLPVDVPIITRRKYVEVLARAKPDTINTEVDDETKATPRNEISRSTHTKYPFRVIQDKNPLGQAWLTECLMEH